MRNQTEIRKNELPLKLFNLPCYSCGIFKERKAKFIKDFHGILRIECEKLGSLRVEEWEHKIRNCHFFSP